MSKSVLLIGATGLTGRQCLNYLLDDPYFREIKVLTRKFLHIEHRKLSEYLINFEELETYRELITADVVFYCLGTTIKQAGSKQSFIHIDKEYTSMIAREAQKNGVEHFQYISSLGANARSLFLYPRVKGETEAILKEISFKKLSIFRPSVLEGDREEVRVIEYTSLKLMKTLKPLLKGSMEKYSPTPVSDLASAMCRQSKAEQAGFHIYGPREIRVLSREYTVG